MQPIFEKQLIDLCGQVGKILLENGAETSRVEGTVEYIGRAANAKITCHATMTGIFIDLDSPDTVPTTHVVKVRVGDFNLRKVDAINALSRQFTEKTINFSELQQAVEKVDHFETDYHWPPKILGAGFVSVAPMLLFKATWADLGLAFFVGIFGYLGAQYVSRHSQAPYIAPAVGGLIISILAVFLQTMGVATSADNIIISALMPLVPGVALTNSLRELIGRHTISGVVRAVDAILVGGAIGAGVVVGTALVQLTVRIFGGNL